MIRSVSNSTKRQADLRPLRFRGRRPLWSGLGRLEPARTGAKNSLMLTPRATASRSRTATVGFSFARSSLLMYVRSTSASTASSSCAVPWATRSRRKFQATNSWAFMGRNDHLEAQETTDYTNVFRYLGALTAIRRGFEAAVRRERGRTLVMRPEPCVGTFRRLVFYALLHHPSRADRLRVRDCCQ